MTYTLYIAAKRYSSWSLRGWLLLEAFGLPFAERIAPLRSAEFDALVAEMAPSRTVPALAHDAPDGRRLVWDSLAIAEYLAERHPDAGLWPAGPAARAWARSITAEAHSSFGAMRKALPMNLGRRYGQKSVSEAVAADTARLAELWTLTRMRFGAGGPFLFGADYTIPDAFFTPYATRIETYGGLLDGAPAAYMHALLTHPPYLKWREAALQETGRLDIYEFDDDDETLG